jgi:predicted homoserine dehydrogenase-like protein
MNYEMFFAGHQDKRVRAALIGVGEFGASLIAQARSIPMLEIPVLCDRNEQRAVAALLDCGVAPTDLAICDTVFAALKALADDKTVIVTDAGLIDLLPIDIIVEATGVPEVAARNAMAAIERGRHVAMVSKEADSVVGPVLHHKAGVAGCVYTPIDGDQPGLLIGLVTWARVLGLEIVAAGKSSEYDFIYDPAAQTISWRDQTIDVPEFADLWPLADDDVGTFLKSRSVALAAFPQSIVPDYCEMGIVTNATGLKPDNARFHAPLARTIEVPGIFRPQEMGGILTNSPVIDVFNCLRRPDEASFAGGVFIVVRCSDKATWKVLQGKGIPVSRQGDHALLYNPQHLLGLEAPISLLSAALLGRSTGGAAPKPIVDLVARTTRDFRAGERLTIIDHHSHAMDGVEPMLLDAAAVTDGNALPYYLALGGLLTRDVVAGEVLTAETVEIPQDSVLHQLRREQDDLFLGDTTV